MDIIYFHAVILSIRLLFLIYFIENYDKKEKFRKNSIKNKMLLFSDASIIFAVVKIAQVSSAFKKNLSVKVMLF